MKRLNIWKSAAIALSLLWIASLAAAQVDATQPSPAPATMPSGGLQVLGKVPHSLSLTFDQLAAMDHVTVTVKGREGDQLSYSGVPLEEILKSAGLEFGHMSTARAAAGMCVIVTGSDGYRVVYSMAELDSQFQKRLVVLADGRDGKPLDPTEGPLRIVAPDETVHARWVKQVISLTVAEP
jgi:DMSO/TMAO reductase YedYZ molybdopterin-dependent catalytic subunit